ncbi:hypothetical protein AGMMS50268_19500 [Spirochaetia bacterium]|nr:hypothetical protein AGMMS50268_19500 [Spirochaetia bacterium]
MKNHRPVQVTIYENGIVDSVKFYQSVKGFYDEHLTQQYRDYHHFRAALALPHKYNSLTFIRHFGRLKLNYAEWVEPWEFNDEQANILTNLGFFRPQGGVAK